MIRDLNDKIKALLDDFVSDGRERGAQAAIYIEGRLVVDAWSGIADVRNARLVNGDTLFPVFSVTKGIFSTVIHRLAERGKLDYDAPIARYWPEFAANGKEGILLRHVLAHTAGVPFMPEGVTPEMLRNWDAICAAIAQLQPFAPAGAVEAYHPATFGWIVGEVARRVDGRSIPQMLEEEICRPLGITRLFCGIPAELEPEVAYLEQMPTPPPDKSPPPHPISPCMLPLYAWMNKPEARRTPQPGASGVASARAVARHYAALLPGGIDGVELLPQARVRVATEVQVPTQGYLPGAIGRKGLGYELGHAIPELRNNPRAFGHCGFGRSMGWADPDHRLAMGITHNRISDHPLVGLVMDEVYRALDAA